MWDSPEEMSLSKQRLDEIAAIRDEDVDYSDIPEIGPDFWRRAKVKKGDESAGIVTEIPRSDASTPWLSDDAGVP